MANQGFWTNLLEGTADRLNAALLQLDTEANKPAGGDVGRQFLASDTLVLFRDNGTDFVEVAAFPKVAKKTADEVVNNSITFQNDDHLLFAVGANETWAFYLIIIADANVSSDIKFIVAGPSGSTREFTTIDIDAGTGSLAKMNTTLTISTDGVVVRRVHFLLGRIDVAGTAGNLQLQWAQNAVHVSDCTVRKGSILVGYKVG